MISGERAARHVWPRGWISTLVSRPGMLVNCGCPDRASDHTRLIVQRLLHLPLLLLRGVIRVDGD